MQTPGTFQHTAIPAQASPRLLLIAPPNSYRTTAFLKAARLHGVDVLIASEGKYSLVGELAGGLHVDLSDPGAVDVLLAANRQRPFCGVLSTDDTTVELGSRIAKALDLPHNPVESARYSHRKDLSREVLANAGVSVPEFRMVNLAEALAPQFKDLAFPCVVKPLSLSASRGVIRADNKQQLLSACARIQLILAGESLQDEFVQSHVLIESFVAGPEVALEGLLHNGKLNVLAIFDKPDPMDGPFFEETYYVTPTRHSEAAQENIITCVKAACAALGFSEGPIHAEIRLSAEACVVLEVASRTIGGECARLLSYGTGHSLESLVIAHATGKTLEIQAAEGGAGVLMIPIAEAGIMRRVEGITAARAVPFIEDILINIREGYELVPLPEGSSYLGFIFACAPTPQQAEAALRAAHAELRIVVAPLMRIKVRSEK